MLDKGRSEPGGAPPATTANSLVVAAAPLGTVLAVVLVVFLTQNMFLVMLPVSMEASGLGAGIMVGLLLAASESLGILVAPPAAAYGDRHGHAKVLKVAGIATAVGMVGLGAATFTDSMWAWVLPVVVYALVRSMAMSGALAVVTGMPRALQVQGLNSVVQRTAAIIGAVLTSYLILADQWAWGFWALALTGAALVVFANRLSTTREPEPALWVSPRDSYRASLRMLRGERGIQASSLVSLTNRMVLVLGNAFFPLSIGAGTAGLAGWVLLFLLFRDLTSVVFGFTFRFLVQRVGFLGSQVVMATSTVAGLLAIGLTDTTVVTVALGAALQGVGVFIAIGSMNLLATAEGLAAGPASGRALRLTSTFYVSSIVALFFPTLFGAVFDAWGGGAVFVIGAVIVAVTAGVAIALIGRWERTARTDESRAG